MSVHMLEKALAVQNEKYLNLVKYNSIIEKISTLISNGMPVESFEISSSIAIIKSALNSLSGHDKEKTELEKIILKYNIPKNFKGGYEKFSSPEFFVENNFNWHNFVTSRHSIRKFKDKIISREIIYDIIRDAEYYPSACNRQPCKIYFSENKNTIDKIIKAGADNFIAKGFHDCFIVTCDRNLLLPSELNDQEFVNTGIFLGYLVLSIHAHGLGSCLCQFLQVNNRQNSIKKQFGLKDSEVIIAFVGFGEIEEKVLTACAARRPVESVAINLDNSNIF